MPKRKPYHDPEITTADKMLDMLTMLHPPQRRRVLSTVCARASTLPYLGKEPEVDERQVPLFDDLDADSVPHMPPLASRAERDAATVTETS